MSKGVFWYYLRKEKVSGYVWLPTLIGCFYLSTLFSDGFAGLVLCWLFFVISVLVYSMVKYSLEPRYSLRQMEISRQKRAGMVQPVRANQRPLDFSSRQALVENVQTEFDGQNKLTEEKKWMFQRDFQEKLGSLNDIKEAEEWDLAIQYCNSMQELESIDVSLRDWWSSKWMGEIKIIEEAMAPPRRSRRIPTHVKREVWERDRGQCVHCGSPEDIHFDHDIPFSKGGSNEVENIQLLCAQCNLKKGSKII